jgi:type IV pilus biogenesis protein PilP
MSQIAKTLISGFIAASLGTALSAQDTSSDLLAKMMAGTSVKADASTSGSADPLRELIRSRVMDLASGSNVSIDPSGVTIKEIDNLNRSAERTKTQLELEKLEMERTKTEIESLLMLYEALGQLEEKEAPQANQGAEKVEAPMIATLSPQEEEMEKLPTLRGVTGAGGKFIAEISTVDGTTMNATVNSTLPDGFFLEEINSESITVRGSTDTSYRLMPKTRSAPAPTDGADGSGQGMPAIDMQGMPFGVF